VTVMTQPDSLAGTLATRFGFGTLWRDVANPGENRRESKWLRHCSGDAAGVTLVIPARYSFDPKRS